ncbi:MAG: SDR family NAD(P)-dependent oxidoreductase [Gracilibacteraceae bacterium]|jgi:NAD(P)-dependent dehydrogenase (short-subunit alcohol dehydrogenase family)|nr:SDR family NAD(P)-dependent oxidoreductase [Gracilibacteraceae bacterium]
MRLKNRVAVVPGGTSGIGKAIALGFAREGATVVVASRSAEKVREAEAELKALGSQGYGTTLDVTDEPSIQKLMSDVKNKYGRIDIMLNSAGAFPACPFLKMTTEKWKQVLDLNLNAPFYCAKAVAPIMAEQNYGRIIFISSAQGLRGIPLMAHYTAAKGGIIAFVRCIAAELGPYNITVNAIACGLTMTGPVSGGLHTKEDQLPVPGKLRLFDDEFELFPGIRLIVTDSHTLGSTIISVNTKQGRAYICGDIIYDQVMQCQKNPYGNLDVETHWNSAADCFGDQLSGNNVNFWGAKRAMHKIMREADLVLPSHDPYVMANYGDTIG